jgi:hypothetical protein
LKTLKATSGTPKGVSGNIKEQKTAIMKSFILKSQSESTNFQLTGESILVVNFRSIKKNRWAERRIYLN